MDSHVNRVHCIGENEGNFDGWWWKKPQWPWQNDRFTLPPLCFIQSMIIRGDDYISCGEPKQSTSEVCKQNSRVQVIYYNRWIRFALKQASFMGYLDFLMLCSIFYSWLGMWMRCIVACIDHNRNVDRKCMVNSLTGEQQFKCKVSFICFLSIVKSLAEFCQSS